MNRYDRIGQEVNTLEEALEDGEGDLTATYDPGNDSVRINDYPLPDGYEPETTDIRIDYPDDWPDLKPRTYVSDHVTVRQYPPLPLADYPTEDGWYAFDVMPAPVYDPETNTTLLAMHWLEKQLFSTLDHMQR